MHTNLRHEIEQLCNGPTALPGWCSKEKGMHLAETVIQFSPQLVVEIGVFGGRSFVPLVLGLEIRGGVTMAYGIDTWSNEAAIEGMDQHDADDRKNIEYWQKLSMSSIMARVSTYLDQRKLWNYAALIQGRSDHACRLFAPNTIDLLHIDGNHTQLISCRDVTSWLPKVKPGGWVFMDDTNWPSTVAAQKLLEAQCVLESVHPGLGTEYRLYRKKL